jgi:hypothetical protein
MSGDTRLSCGQLERTDADCFPGILNARLCDSIACSYAYFILPYARVEPTYKRCEAGRQ